MKMQQRARNSGGGFQSDTGSVSSGVSGSTQRRRRRKQQLHGQVQQGSLLWTILLLGLIFCCVNFFYIVYFVGDDTRYRITETSIRADENGNKDSLILMKAKERTSFDLNKESSTSDIKANLKAKEKKGGLPGMSENRVKHEIDVKADPTNEGGHDTKNKDSHISIKATEITSSDLNKESSTSDVKANLKAKEKRGGLPGMSENQAIQEIDAFKADPTNEGGPDSKKQKVLDKGPIINLLLQAGIVPSIGDMDLEMLDALPNWQDVVDLYGDKPVYRGLDQCEKFRNSGNDFDHFVSVAGTFNTGTNLMSDLLHYNCHMPARMKKFGKANRGVRWQVLWGKHTPVNDEDFRQKHKVYDDANLTADNIFPAVMVRDPFKWMQSMCRHHYAANWGNYNMTRHCPNLVPDETDFQEFPWLKERYEKNESASVSVKIKYKEFTRRHDSLVHMWNEWFNAYYHASFPRLIIRFEDIIFHPKEVTKTFCECAGGELDQHHKFHFIVDSAKKGGDKIHGKHRTSYLDALKKYGTEKGRYDLYQQPDLDYSTKHLDHTLMEAFQYKYPPMAPYIEEK